MYVLVYIYTHRCTHINTYSYTYAYMYTFSYTYTYTVSYTHSYTYAHTNMYRYRYTNRYTYTYTYTIFTRLSALLPKLLYFVTLQVTVTCVFQAPRVPKRKLMPFKGSWVFKPIGLGVGIKLTSTYMQLFINNQKNIQPIVLSQAAFQRLCQEIFVELKNTQFDAVCYISQVVAILALKRIGNV
eukprot:TRINITY_DN8960_c0_g1_i2.p1 TRINITY_DN8960_c0_g1~~TRINITY_DN8960_c0_g1_i2.p1  ORF type:complete len:198 (-),score=-25.05 TRINITY_DN8960_c0_g1_i2:218-769(-)